MGAALFSLAFFTKQTALAGPIAAALYLVVRDWRLGLKWCVVMFLAVVVPFAALDLATDHWFYLKMVVYHSLPFSRTTLTRLLQYAFWDNEWPLILLALGYSIFMLVRLVRLWRSGETWRVPCSSPCSSWRRSLPFQRAGSSARTTITCSCPGWPSVRARVQCCARSISGEWELRPAFAVPAAAATLLLLLGYVLFTSQPSFWYAPDLTMPTAAQQEQLRKIAQYIKTTPGEPSSRTIPAWWPSPANKPLTTTPSQ